MPWNHRTRVVAVGIAIQPVPGVFTAPTAADLIGVSTPNNAEDIISAQDPTMTGGIWEAPRIYLGRTGTAGATVPMRGWGGGAVPAANAFVWGRILQAAGFAEIRQQVATNAVLQAGSTASSLVLAAAESAVDDFLIGAPISQAALGTGFQQYSLISDYIGATKTAHLPETIVPPAAGQAYEIPPHLTYLLGTMTAAPPLLSMSVWRDKKRYNYRDCRLTSLGFDFPVANEANQVFPSFDFTAKGNRESVVDEASPLLPDAVLRVPVPALRGGKFVMDRVKLGHASLRAGINAEVGAASNANQAAGQDGYEIISGSRTIETDLNQMNVTDFDLDARIDNQTVMSMLTTWGAGAGNRFGFLLPGVVLDPHNPGDRNGFVNLTGAAHAVDVDKSMALAIW